MSRRTASTVLLPSTLALLGAIGTAAAQGLPPVIRAQVGETLEQADAKMIQNGYRQQAQRPPVHFYWNGSSCAALTVRDTKVVAAAPATPFDCEQVKGQPHVSRPDRAGGIGGLPAAPVPNREMPGYRRGGTPAAEYDRGYDDGARGSVARGGRGSEEYTRGYAEGVRRRNEDARTRHGDAARYDARVPGWMVGRYAGYDSRDRQDLSIDISPSGRVTSRSPSREPVYGQIAGGDQLVFDNGARFTIEQSRNGVRLRKVDDRRYVVDLQRGR